MLIIIPKILFSFVNANFGALYRSIYLKREFFIQKQLSYFNKKSIYVGLRLLTMASLGI